MAAPPDQITPLRSPVENPAVMCRGARHFQVCPHVLVVDDDPGFSGPHRSDRIDPKLRVVGSGSDASERAAMVRLLRAERLPLRRAPSRAVAARSSRRGAPLCARDTGGGPLRLRRRGYDHGHDPRRGDELHRPRAQLATTCWMIPPGDSRPGLDAGLRGHRLGRAELRGQGEEAQGKVILLRNVLDHKPHECRLPAGGRYRDSRVDLLRGRSAGSTARRSGRRTCGCGCGRQRSGPRSLRLQAIRLALGHLPHLPGGCPLHLNGVAGGGEVS